MTDQKNKDGDNVAGDKYVKYEKHNHYANAPETPKTTDKNYPKIQITKLPHTGSRLFGRKTELTLLDNAWKDKQTNILILKAFGGTGKTALMKKWLDNLALDNFRDATAVYTWSFYSQGSAEDKQASADPFFDDALDWFGYQGDPLPSAHAKGLKLAELILPPSWIPSPS